MLRGANRIRISQTGNRMTNPFAPATPAQPQQPQQQPAAPANPFSPAQPQHQPGPGMNGYYAQPAPQQPQPTSPYHAVAPAGPVTPAPDLDMSRLSSAGAPVIGEGKGAKLPDMFGRLVLIFPLAIQRVPRNPQYITQEQRARGDLDQDRLTATVVVLDDGQGGQRPIEYGGKPYALPATPHTDSAPLPYVRKGMWINQSRLISQLRDHLPTAPGGAPSMVAGRVHKAGPNQNDPWYLIGATEQEIAMVQQYLAAVKAGQFPHPLA
jgi:hypothetical protein